MYRSTAVGTSETSRVHFNQFLRKRIIQLRRRRISNSLFMFFDMWVSGCMLEGKESDMLRNGDIANEWRTRERVTSPRGTKFARVQF